MKKEKKNLFFFSLFVLYIYFQGAKKFFNYSNAKLEVRAPYEIMSPSVYASVSLTVLCCRIDWGSETR